MACRPLSVDIQKIHSLPLSEKDKMMLEDILTKQFVSGYIKKSRRKRKRGTRRGGNLCSKLECVTLMSSMIFVGYNIRTCAINKHLIDVIQYVLSTYRGTLSVLLGKNAAAAYKAAQSKPQEEQDAIMFKETMDWAGKLVLLHRLLGILVGYIRAMKANPLQCKTYLPGPVIELLEVFCKVDKGQMPPGAAKEAVAEILGARDSPREEFFDAKSDHS